MSGDYELNFHLELQLQSMSITSIHKSSPGYLTVRTSICICLWAAMDSHCLELFVNTLVYEGLHFGLLLIDPCDSYYQIVFAFPSNSFTFSRGSDPGKREEIEIGETMIRS